MIRTWTRPPRELAVAAQTVAAALAAIAAGDPLLANKLLARSVHAGVWPADIIAATIEQTGGALP